MTPDHSLRLATLLRAMQEVVLPAIDPKNRLAIDQANIVVGNLRLLLDQCDKAYQYEWVELREYFDLVSAISSSAQSSGNADEALQAADAALAASRALVAMEIPTQGELVARVRDLKGAADALLHAAYQQGSPEHRARVDTLVHEQAQRQLTRERVWFRKAGFELDAGQLPSMEDVLT
jgi:hypothetical protein